MCFASQCVYGVFFFTVIVVTCIIIYIQYHVLRHCMYNVLGHSPDMVFIITVYMVFNITVYIYGVLPHSTYGWVFDITMRIW